MTAIIRIAMWSGPRNISTAMMRSFGSRPDTVVVDEPYYAHYLKARPEVDHPGREEVIARHEADPGRIASGLLGPLPLGRSIFYQKHMAHHMLEGLDLSWMDHPEVRHAFLIRDPAEVIASFIKIALNPPRPEDLGLPQQVELFERIANRTGNAPPVVDAADILKAPRASLSTLCAAVGIPFDERMLAWPPGRRETDGVWAPHWYANVEASTGFEAYQPRNPSLPDHLMPVLEECRGLYERLAAHRLIRGSPSGRS